MTHPLPSLRPAAIDPRRVEARPILLPASRRKHSSLRWFVFSIAANIGFTAWLIIFWRLWA